MKLCKPWILKFLSWGFAENDSVMTHDLWLVQHYMQTYISRLYVCVYIYIYIYIWLLLMWKLINQLPDRFQIRIWKVTVNQYKMKSQFFFLFLFWLCVCVKSFGLLVTKINNKKTSKIFQFRPTKEEKFKLMTPWFIRVFFFFFW